MTPEALRTIREARGLTREELAKELNCSASAIVQWEGKKRDIPHWVEEKLLANYELKCSLGFLQELIEIAKAENISFDQLMAEAFQDVVAKRKARQKSKPNSNILDLNEHILKDRVAEDGEEYGGAKA